MSNVAQGQPAPQTREEFRSRHANEAALVVMELAAAFKRFDVDYSDADLVAAATVYAGMLAGDA